MKDTGLLLRQLEACVQEEIGAQGRALARLEAQEAALRAGAPQEIAASTRDLEDELESAGSRGERRSLLARALGARWGIDPKALTLASIAERGAKEGTRLVRLRDELRRATAGVARQVRRNALLARLHQRAWSEILAGSLEAAGGADSPIEETRGRLVDAEA